MVQAEVKSGVFETEGEPEWVRGLGSGETRVSPVFGLSGVMHIL